MNIKSDLGSKQTFESGPAKVYTVPDESEPMNNYVPPQFAQAPPQPGAPVPLSPEEMDHFNELKKQTKERSRQLSPEVKKRAEFLTGLGRMTDEFEFEGVKFTIQTLKNKEVKAITKIISFDGLNGAEFAFELRNHTLARSVYKVNDYSLSELIGSDRLEDKLALFDDFDEHTVEFIHSKYQKLVEKAKEKYGINNEEDVAEVTEAVKKQ